MKTVEILGQTYLCATEWNRLTPKQALHISGAMNHFMVEMSRPRPDVETLHSNLRWQVTLALLDITPRRFAKIRERIFRKDGEVKGANQLASLIFSIANPFLESTTPLTRNHLPTITWPLVNSVKYHGPADRLSNLTIEEFAFADSMFLKHWQSPNEDYIDGLISILWRKPNPEAEARAADQRLPFKKHTFVADAKPFRTLSPAAKNYVFTFYKGCRTHIEQTFINLFPSSTEASAKEDKQAFSSQWTKVIATVTEKITDIESVRNTNLWDFLGHMDRQIAENRKREMDAALRKTSA